MNLIDITELQNTLAKLRSLYHAAEPKTLCLQKIIIKPNWSIVITASGSCGLAMNYSGAYNENNSQEIKVNELKAFVGKSLFDLAETVLNTNTLRGRSIGVAAINALSQPFLTVSALTERGFSARESVPDFSAFIKPTDTVTMVGYSGIIWKMLYGKCREVCATDMRPLHSFRPIFIGENIEYGLPEVKLYPADDNETVLNRSDVVLITASTLVNGTFAELMRYAARARLVGLFGPTGSQIPDVLFQHGVDFNFTFCTADLKRLETEMYDDLDIDEWPRDTQKPRFIIRKDTLSP